MTSLSVSVTPSQPSTFEPTTRLLSINPAALTIPKWRTFELLRWMQNLHNSKGLQNFVRRYIFSRWTTFIKSTFTKKNKNTNMPDGWNLKFKFCFMETTDSPLHLDEGSTVREISWTYLQVLFESWFFDGAFEYGHGGTFKLLRWM
jgi:hypothetical protein